MAQSNGHLLFPSGRLRRQDAHRQPRRRDEKPIARELRKQGLTPVYVGVAPKGTSFEIKLPAFGGGKRRDVLFFTQELSTLLNAGVPLDRALSITAELTERASFRFIVLDVLRVLKGGRSLADSLATHPDYFSDLYHQHGARGRGVGIAGHRFSSAWRNSSAPATICATTSSRR